MKDEPCSSLRVMTDKDLDLVLSWRNHPEVRKYMYTQHEIGFDEHFKWFSHASKDANRHLLIFELDDKPLGFINIYVHGKSGVSEWGFYMAPEAARGTGMILGLDALKYAFVNVDLHKLCGQALAYNERSVKFHEKLGFKQEGVLREHHFDGNKYHDVVCFGLLASEWHQSNAEIVR